MEMSAQMSAEINRAGVCSRLRGGRGRRRTQNPMEDLYFNELLLWPSSTSQLRRVKLGCVLPEEADSEEEEVGEGPTILRMAGGSPLA